jgi:hypothetical protein
MKKEIKYHTDPSGHCEVYAGKTLIARAYVGEDGYEVRILQGMDRKETMKKIKEDCPEFLEANNVPDNYRPHLFSASKKK